jgi:transposase-like protein
MTSTTGPDEVLKQDRRGRVRVGRERRQALVEEFSRSGLSAAEFARMAGIKYSTFANWLQEWRKARPPVVEPSREVLVGDAGIRLLEAVVEDRAHGTTGSSAGLSIELPGGARLTMHSPTQLAMAVELLSLLAQRHRGC